jgi:hypothetical protein
MTPLDLNISALNISALGLHDLLLPFMGLVTGLLLGALGSGGSILALPTFVYVAGLPIKSSVATSLAAGGGDQPDRSDSGKASVQHPRLPGAGSGRAGDDPDDDGRPGRCVPGGATLGSCAC